MRQLETAFRQAERLLAEGEHRRALDAYRDLLAHRLAAVGGKEHRFTAGDLVLMERVAELAVLFGATEPAEALLHGMAELCHDAGNIFGADWATVKRIQIALAEGRLRDADELLGHLAPTVGEHRELEITDAGLRRWAAACRFVNADHRQVLLPVVCLILGQLLAALGQFSQSLLLLDTGIENLTEDHPDLAQRLRRPLRLARASALLQMGELASAGLELEELENGDLESEPELPEEPAHAVQHRELAAQLALLQGRYGVARRRLEEVLDLCRRGGFTAARLTARLNLARALTLLNHTRQAEELIADLPGQAYDLGLPGLAARAEGLLPILRARRQSLVPEVRAGSLAIAPPVIESWHPTAPPAVGEGPEQNQPPPELPQAADFLTWYEDRELAFRWTLARDLQAAVRILAQMDAVFRSTDSALLHARLDALHGLVAYYLGRLDDAEGWLESARTGLRAMELLPELWQTQRALGWCWARRGRPEEEQRTLARENEALLQHLAGSLEGADRAVYLLNKWTAEEEALAHRIDALTAHRAQPLTGSWPRRLVTRMKQRWRELHRLHELLDELDLYGDLLAREALEGEASDASGSGEATTPRVESSANRKGLWRRLLTHPLRTGTLRFLVLPDRVVMVNLGWCRLDFTVAPVTRIQVRELVARWHRSMLATAHTRDLVFAGGEGALESEGWAPAPQAPADTPESTATELSEALRLPARLDSLPRRTRRLRLVLDDSLHGFPFAALRHRGAYLVERWALTTALSVDVSAGPSTRFSKGSFTGLSTSLSTQAPAPNGSTPPGELATSPDGSRPRRRTGSALLVGVSRGTADPPLPPLPGVAREIAALGQDFQTRGWPIHQLTDAQADRRTVVEALGRVDLAHLACHGLFRPDRPDASGLFLIPGDGRKAQLLSLRDLSRLDLRHLRHITLSACWSADNYILPGRRILSLPEVLTRAGTASVLSHLWPLDDTVAVTLMQRFYHHLRTLPRDEALRRTQLECLREPETADPYFWAGLRLGGEAGRLRW